MKSIPSKNELRETMKSRLAALTQDEYQSLNRDLYHNFFKLDILNKINIIMIYYSIRKEVETVLIINRLLALGKTIALPICIPEHDLKAAVIRDLCQLRPARFGLMEPEPGSAVLDNGELELIVVPGVAFDRQGNRLGHGAGYYDRFLSKTIKAFKLGLAYDFQLVSEVPVTSHDIKVNGVMTPSRALEFKLYG